MSHYFPRLLMIFVLTIIANYSISQNDSSIVDRSWDVCTSTKKVIDSDCFYYVTYTFNSDASYNESRQYSIGKITANYRGTWKLVKNKLIITTSPENGMTRATQKHKIKWIDSSTFYTTGHEGFLGVKVYTYYKSND